VSSWPQLAGSQLIRPRRPSSLVVRCGLTDLLFADTSASGVFYYRQRLDPGVLAGSLAIALEHVPVFAGRLRAAGDRLEIVCGSAGVPLVISDVEETLAGAISRATLPSAGLVDHVDGLSARAGSEPLLTIRVSRLSDGGTALGCSWHHAAGDMHSFILLMRAWAAAAAGTSLPPVQLIDDPDDYLGQVLPAADCGRPGFRVLSPGEAAVLEGDVQAAIRSGRTVQAYFTQAEVARMRQEFGAVTGQRLSANDVLCGHLVATIRELDGDAEARRLAMPVDLRPRTPIPDGVIGNIVGEIFLTCGPRSAPEAIAAQVRSALEDFVQSHLSVRASLRFLSELGPARLRDCVPIGFDLAAKTFAFTNWSRLGLDHLAFAGEPPVLFTPAANLQLPWSALLVDGFDQAGHFLAISVPSRLAARLRSQDGRAALHRFRDPGDPLPELATAVHRLI
jgi:hypothetical protein